MMNVLHKIKLQLILALIVVLQFSFFTTTVYADEEFTTSIIEETTVSDVVEVVPNDNTLSYSDKVNISLIIIQTFVICLFISMKKGD